MDITQVVLTTRDIMALLTKKTIELLDTMESKYIYDEDFDQSKPWFNKFLENCEALYKIEQPSTKDKENVSSALKPFVKNLIER